MDTLRETYFKASKKQKGVILDSYCASSGEERKYAIKKMRYKVKIKNKEDRKRRSKTYDGQVVAVLVVMWRIFDRPCGARLKPLLMKETERLRRLKEVRCSDRSATLLMRMSPASIDRALVPTKEEERTQKKYRSKQDATLLKTVPIKTAADIDRTQVGISLTV